MASFPADDRFPPVASKVVAEETKAPALFDLRGKTALVTGGNGGIGSGIAQGLAEAGADMIILHIPGEVSEFPERLAKATGRRVDTYACDLADSDKIRETIDLVLSRDKRTVDILCNVAGISGGFVPILDETDVHRNLVSSNVSGARRGQTSTDTYQVFQIHYHAVYILSQLLANHMAERGTGGKIINISSISVDKPMTRWSVYGPAKAAVSQLTKSLANEFAIYNIQVNAIRPGYV